ncbi:hypothetical protein SPHINGOR109_30035 [Sphingorhabdus sp. 109]|nr:hypothetical protein SPHINGOR109_30035 [Sphingorhabdus sp. 109]
MHMLACTESFRLEQDRCLGIFPFRAPAFVAELPHPARFGYFLFDILYHIPYLADDSCPQDIRDKCVTQKIPDFRCHSGAARNSCLCPAGKDRRTALHRPRR